MNTPHDHTYLSHPLYVIPKDLDSAHALFDGEGNVTRLAANGSLHVYATDIGPDTPIPCPNLYDEDGYELSDFAQPYTPTNDEVVRALRGPMGPAGPMGPQGGSA